MAVTDGASAGRGVLWPLVQALLRVPCLAELADRNLVVRMLADELGDPLPVDEHPKAVHHLFSLAAVCARRPDGLPSLLVVLDRLEPGSRQMIEVSRIIDQMTAAELWPQEERDRLFGLLSGVVVPDIIEIYRFVSGTLAPELSVQTTYREVFRALETLNAGPDGLPKPLTFVEHLAGRVRFELAVELRRWADRQAARMEILTELQALRRHLGQSAPRTPPPKAPAYLVLQLQREGPSGDVYRLGHWRQLDLSDGWHPERGEDFVGDIDEVKYRVAALVEAVEAEWARYEPDIRLEFVLSRELLNLGVDQWQWETDTVIPEPLGCHFPVAVRDLERMRSSKWHRYWYGRWKELKIQLDKLGAVSVESSYWSKLYDANGIRDLIAHFARQLNLVSVVLGEPPRRNALGRDEVAVALRAGFPLIVWHREDCGSEEFVTTVRELLHGDGPEHVLERARMVRANAFAAGPHARHVGHDLTLLWDDPQRLVVPANPAAPEGVTAA